MIHFAIEAFTSIGLLARQVFTLNGNQQTEEVRVGEGNWSCRVAVAHNGMHDDEGQISKDCLWIEVMDGPMKGNFFPLTILLQDGLIGVWQLLGGRHLRNDSLASLRRFDESCSIDPVVLQEIEHSLDKVLQGFGYDRVWNANGGEAYDGDWPDTVVFPVSDDEKTEPYHVIPEMTPTTTYSVMN